MNQSPFEKFPAADHRRKLLSRNEVVILPLDLAGARSAGGVRDRKVQQEADLFEMGADRVDERRFPGALRAGDDEQGAVGVEVTRHACHPERSEGPVWAGGTQSPFVAPPDRPGPSLRSG